MAAAIAVTAVITLAAGVAAQTAESVVQAVSQRGTAGVVARRGRAGPFDGALNHAGAGHGFLVGDAHADGALDLARNLAGFAHGVLLLPLLFAAFISAHLDLFFLPLGLANRDFALHFFLAANLLADLDLAAFILRAEHPHLAGARAPVAAGVMAIILAAAVPVTAEQAAPAARFTAFPVAQAFQALLGDGLFDVPPDLLADFAFFAHGHFVADFPSFFFDDGDARHARDVPFFLHLNGFTAEAVNCFLLALNLVHRALDGVGLRHAFRDLDGARARVAARRRTTMVSPSG